MKNKKKEEKGLVTIYLKYEFDRDKESLCGRWQHTSIRGGPYNVPTENVYFKNKSNPYKSIHVSIKLSTGCVTLEWSWMLLPHGPKWFPITGTIFGRAYVGRAVPAHTSSAVTPSEESRVNASLCLTRPPREARACRILTDKIGRRNFWDEPTHSTAGGSLRLHGFEMITSPLAQMQLISQGIFIGWSLLL